MASSDVDRGSGIDEGHCGVRLGRLREVGGAIKQKAAIRPLRRVTRNDGRGRTYEKQRQHLCLRGVAIVTLLPVNADRLILLVRSPA